VQVTDSCLKLAYLGRTRHKQTFYIIENSLFAQVDAPGVFERSEAAGQSVVYKQVMEHQYYIVK
jgi:hypothetical protein